LPGDNWAGVDMCVHSVCVQCPGFNSVDTGSYWKCQSFCCDSENKLTKNKVGAILKV